MYQCNICYDDLKEYDQIKMGCCSFVCCKTCIKKTDKCPQCKVDYFYQGYIKLLEQYVTNSDKTITTQCEVIEKLLIKQANLECEIRSLKFENNYVKQRLDETVEALVHLDQSIKEQEEEENNIEQLEDVIKRYNLNLI